MPCPLALLRGHLQIPDEREILKRRLKAEERKKHTSVALTVMDGTSRAGSRTANLEGAAAASVWDADAGGGHFDPVTLVVKDLRCAASMRTAAAGLIATASTLQHPEQWLLVTFSQSSASWYAAFGAVLRAWLCLCLGVVEHKHLWLFLVLSLLMPRCRYFVPNPSATSSSRRLNGPSRRSSAAGTAGSGTASAATSSGGAAEGALSPVGAQPGGSLGGDHSAAAESGAVVRVSVPGRVSQPGPAAGGMEEVPQELELLKGINAFATSGNLVALMDGSGGFCAVL